MTELKPLWVKGSLCYELPIILAVDTTIVLRALGERRGDPANETIRRGLSVLNFVENEIAQGNQFVLIEPSPSRWWWPRRRVRARQIDLVG
ncbi:hypothetical protein JOF29_004417 [Kribbella aluminosa]|uniref:PIN domain-containing protein n=1 Tax=Kribbella aluminosa TaxID=416017 RepID=A0ABS4UNS9_9ACTN|nr:hypothetical protein [Kribbella aluminosa]MBP2353307.1 hypothetical protein [Kribbella aluminosa]